MPSFDYSPPPFTGPSTRYIYMVPEIRKDMIFDRSVDAYSFGIMLYEMTEGGVPFRSKPAEEAVKLMCFEQQRPPLETKSKSYPPE
ncbi:hypothetical protein F3Y22_tig00111941pilonHSYRG00004 [Hibiscus syriacus]|uniref:Protein kinase domain-containing protein n=1 Tax=Hibiscus syriacus TaxID=106335 RepID=A0A6A2YEU2_HIBSY|nr:hypothetical protein F3Y22_tig00111941pilonHSYRG00004 [Hibiscus syriacus]